MKFTLSLVIISATLSCLYASPVVTPADSYIIKLKSDGGAKRLKAFVREYSTQRGASIEANSIKYIYDPAIFNGVAGKFTKKFLDSFKEAHKGEIEYIEEDGEAHILAVQNSPPSWGQTRVSEQNLDLKKPYSYPDSAGDGVDVYIIDTGILPTHVDFGGRADIAKSFVTGEDPSDQNGHGSHVAGTIGSSTYGLAKKVKLHGVKVLNGSGSGTWSDVIAGINFVGQQKKDDPKKKVVANMSLGGGKNQAVDDAINGVIAAGVVMIVAAGNNGGDACQISPAGAAKVFAVGATDNTDTMASFSNRGNCVKLFAPGVGITSVWIGAGNNNKNTISGTSMASPHVAGVAALYMGEKNYNSAEEVYADLVKNATKGKVGGPIGSTPNLILYDNSGVTADKE